MNNKKNEIKNKKNQNKEYVWEFTNQKKLSKSDFIKYFEKKVFKTIRKYSMLPKDKNIKLSDSKDLQTLVLKKVLEKKFKITLSKKPNLIAKSSTEISEITLQNIISGKFSGPKPNNIPFNPLYFHSDDEIDMYSKLSNIKGIKRKENKKIKSIFETFKKKNQDLELNILKTLEQIQEG